MIRFYLVIVYCFFVCVADLSALSTQSCFSFGDAAHNDPNSLYVASLNVGTGECHIVRSGDDSIIVDAGVRRSSFPMNDIVDFVAGMLGHNLRPDPRDPGDDPQNPNMIFSNSTLHAIFVTHPHDDHTNMIESILDDESIVKARNFSAFLGGLGAEYEDFLVRKITDLNPRALLNEGQHVIGRFTIYAYDVDSSFDNAQNPQDMNRFGAVIGLNFANKRIAFMGDIDNDGFKGIYRSVLGNHIVGQPLTAPLHPMHNFLQQSDIVTGPHHGLLNNYEGYIYKSLINSRPNRIFLVSGNPEDQFPILSDILLDVDRAARLTWQHNLSLMNFFIDRTQHDFSDSISCFGTDVPLFSTYDAPSGFIWTKIETNGHAFIYDGTVFRQVL